MLNGLADSPSPTGPFCGGGAEAGWSRRAARLPPTDRPERCDGGADVVEHRDGPANGPSLPRPAQRTGAGAPGSVDNPDLVVEVLGRTVVPRTDVGGLVTTAPGAGVLSTAVVEAVGVGAGAGALLPDEHDVAVAASATAISRPGLNGRVE